jgi:uncharacterized protein with HEPN domain
LSDHEKRAWRFYLDDMIACAEKVIAYAEGFDQAGFIASALHYDATLRNLELIGEAATHIPGTVRAAHPKIPWRLAIAPRNQLILGVDDDVLWTIIRDDVPVLLAQLRALKADSK